MSNIKLDNAGNDAAKNDETTSAATQVVHDTGAIDSESTMITSTPSVKPKFFQNMPKNELGDYLTRATEIASITFATSDVPLTVTNLGLPWNLFLNNPRIADKTQSYFYIRGTLQLIIVCNFPGNCYGSYVVSALPNSDSLEEVQTIVSQSLNAVNCMQVDHFARVDCANAENIVLQLPFIWPYDWASIEDAPGGISTIRTSWSLFLTCLSPVRTAIPGGEALGSAKIYANLLDYELTVPHIGLQGQKTAHLKPNHAMQHLAPDVHAKVAAKASKVSGAVGKVQAVAEKLEKVPVIGAYAAPVAKAAAAAKKVFSMFGFTRENAEDHPTPVVMRSVTNVAHFDGPDSSEMAAFTASNTISIDPTLAGFDDRDCLATADLFNRWTHIKTFTWSFSNAQDSTLVTVPITPMFCTGGTDAKFNFTTAGYFGMPFKYWRGDMEYLVVLPVSKLHRGSLQAVWLPYKSTGLPSTVTNTTLNQIWDVSSGGEKIFSIGYARDIPFAETRIMADGLSILNYDFTNGTFALRVVNPLQSQNNESFVTGHIFARAKNMEFAVPQEQIWVPQVTPFVTPLYDGVLLEGATGDEDDHEPELVELVPSSGSYPMEDLLFGERIESVRAMMQKPYRCFWTDPNGYFVANDNMTWQRPYGMFIPQFGPFPTAGFISTQHQRFLADTFTYFGYYRALFVGLACSERFKYIARGNNDFFGAGPFYLSGIQGASTNLPSNIPGTLVPMSVTGTNFGYEVVVPYYCRRKFVNSFSVKYYRPDQNNSPNTKFTQICLGQMSSSQFRANNPGPIYHCAGPDIRCAGFRQVPVVKFFNQPIDNNMNNFYMRAT